jgi:hypothetical protein
MEQEMRKTIIIIAILLLAVMLFSACANKDSNGLRINGPGKLKNEPEQSEQVKEETITGAEANIRDNDEVDMPAETATPSASATAAASATPDVQSTEPPKTEAPTLPSNDYTKLMPALRIPLKEVIDNEFGTTAVYNTVSDKDFEAIVNAAQKKGFTENIEQAELTFTATNKDGMFIKIAVDSEALRISVYADEKHFE